MFKRIVIPVDGSETANKALTVALQMARDSGGSVRIVHVIEGTNYSSSAMQTEGFAGGAMDSIRIAAQKILDEALALAQPFGVAVDTKLFDTFDGRLADAVGNAATDWQADLIVVGTHGRRGIGRMLMGSGAEQIMRQAPIPVLVIRAQDAAGA